MSKENKTLDKPQNGNDFIADVSNSKRFDKQDLLRAYQAGAIEQKSINPDTFGFDKLKELQQDSEEWYVRYTG